MAHVLLDCACVHVYEPPSLIMDAMTNHPNNYTFLKLIFLFLRFDYFRHVGCSH